MRAKSNLLALTLSVVPLGNMAQGVAQLADELLTIPSYLTDAIFEVLLPSAEDPIVYNLTLQSDATLTDSLSPCDYLIRWQAMTPSGMLDGFSSYFDGNHYRYRNNRLQEYHMEENPLVFMPQGQGSQWKQGVQAQAQFAEYLPQFLSVRLKEISTDSAYTYQFYPDTIVNGHRSLAIDGIKRTSGYDSQYFTYVFDYDTHLPVSIDLETSPGTISEQVITVNYKPTTNSQRISYNEDALIEEWPEIFEKYREGTFRAENLTGQPLPSFSCQLLDSDQRLEHLRGEKLKNNSIIVFLDPQVNSTANTIANVREALEMLPSSFEVVWAFKSNHPDEILEIIGELRPQEKALTSVGSLLRNCGVTLFPTLLFIDADGIIKDTVIAYNQNLSEIVIEKAISNF